MRRDDATRAAAEFDLFYSRSVAVVRQMVLLTGDMSEAEDATQEAFERAWLHWSDCMSAATASGSGRSPG